MSTYTAVENGQRVFDQEFVVIVRADTREKLQRSVEKIRATLREQTAQLDPKTAICMQDKAIQSATPIGLSVLDRTAVALGGAIGALLASPHNASVLEEDGVEFGIRKGTRSSVLIDPFAARTATSSLRSAN